MEQQLLNLNDNQIIQFGLALAGKPVSIADKIQNARTLNYICQNKPSFQSLCNDLWLKLWQEDIGGKMPNLNYLTYLQHLAILTQNDRMIEASRNNYDKLLLWSLKRGADVHYHDDEALKDASKYGNVEVVKILLDKGANIHTEDDLPIILASMNGNLETVKLLDNYDANLLAQNQRALRLAASNGHRNVVDYLIRNGGDINILSGKQKRQYLP